jgi:hypothetical protein
MALSIKSTEVEELVAAVAAMTGESKTAPPDQLGRRLSRAEEDEILGYGSSVIA